MSSRYDLLARIERTLDCAAELWEAAGRLPHDYAVALHAGEVPQCRCGEWGTSFAIELGSTPVCAHPRSQRHRRPCFCLTSIGGETVAVTPTVVAALQHTQLWLAGHTMVSLSAGPVHTPTDPLSVIWVTQLIAPSLDDLTLAFAPLRTRVTVAELPCPLIFTSLVRPRALPG